MWCDEHVPVRVYKRGAVRIGIRPGRLYRRVTPSSLQRVRRLVRGCWETEGGVLLFNWDRSGRRLERLRSRELDELEEPDPYLWYWQSLVDSGEFVRVV